MENHSLWLEMVSPVYGSAVLNIDGWQSRSSRLKWLLNESFPVKSSVVGHPYMRAFEKAVAFFGADIVGVQLPEDDRSAIY